MATYYVSSSEGNDSSADPTNIATPIQTCAKVQNLEPFSPGDTILFKRGDTWREQLWVDKGGSGAPGSPITVDAYGTGAKPLLLGSRDLKTAYSWTDLGSNLWQTDAITQPTWSYLDDVGNLWFNGATSLGRKRIALTTTGTAAAATASTITLAATSPNYKNCYYLASIHIDSGTGSGQTRILGHTWEATRTIPVTVSWDVTPSTDSVYTVTFVQSQGDFYYNPADNKITMYSVGSPATYYSAIEAACTASGITFTDGSGSASKAYWNVRNLAIRYWADMGVSLGGNSNANMLFEYLDIANVGGGYQASNRDGNGFIIHAGDNCIFRYNTLTQVCETGISFQGDNTGGKVSNIYIYGNIVNSAKNGLDVWCWADGAELDNFVFAHNIIYNVGGEMGHDMSYKATAHGILVYDYGTVTNAKILNNIVHTVADSMDLPGQQNGTLSFDALTTTGYTIDYNCYYDPNGHTFLDRPSTTYDLAAWRAATSFDDHSIVTDPGFVSAGTDFHLASTESPCYDTGTDAGLNLPYLGSGYDMGVYEYDAPNILKRCPFRKAV